MSFNLATILEESSRVHPNRPLIISGDETLTFGDVDRRASRVAGALRGRGLRVGERVAVQLPNVPEFIDAYFGILKAGLVMVPLNPLLTGSEIAFQLADSGARLVITDVSTVNAARAGGAGSGDVELLVVGSGGADDFAVLQEAAPLTTAVPTSPEDTAVVLYTSGTTGRPKGAELMHFQLYMNCTVAGELFDVGADDVMMAVLPLFHVFGLSSVLNVAVRYGTRLVLRSRFAANDVLDSIARHGVTVFPGVPTMFVALLQVGVGDRDVRTLRRGISGGASMPVEVIRGIEHAFPDLVVLEGYGLSETASTSSFNVDADQRRVASIGKPIWGVEMKIVDEQGRELDRGPSNIGEIVIRGHNVMKGYLGRPDATAEAIRDGWFHSGDLGYRDSDGFFYVSDRLKDLIIRGGYNVYPREVEEVLYAYPDVVEAAVVGRPHKRLGEEVVAHVVLVQGSGATAADLDAFVRERLAAYKWPREYQLEGELPKGASGKILKRELRVQPKANSAGVS